MSIISTALYTSLSRPAWSLGLAWIVIACATDNAGEYISNSFRKTESIEKTQFVFCFRNSQIFTLLPRLDTSEQTFAFSLFTKSVDN